MNHQKTLIEEQERAHALQAEMHAEVAAMFGAILVGDVDEAIGGGSEVIRLAAVAVNLVRRLHARVAAPLPQAHSSRLAGSGRAHETPGWLDA